MLWILIKLVALTSFAGSGAIIGTGLGSLFDKQNDDIAADWSSSAGFIVGAIVGIVVYINS
jgi:hypothetical protein